LFFTPPNAVHTFSVIGEGPARVIGFHFPGGFHKLYAEIATAFTSDGPPDFAAMAAAATRHNAEIVGPPIAATLDHI
jgi:hypothetical protein